MIHRHWRHSPWSWLAGAALAAACDMNPQPEVPSAQSDGAAGQPELVDAGSGGTGFGGYGGTAGSINGTAGAISLSDADALEGEPAPDAEDSGDGGASEGGADAELDALADASG